MNRLRKWLGSQLNDMSPREFTAFSLLTVVAGFSIGLFFMLRLGAAAAVTLAAVCLAGMLWCVRTLKRRGN